MDVLMVDVCIIPRVWSPLDFSGLRFHFPRSLSLSFLCVFSLLLLSSLFRSWKAQVANMGKAVDSIKDEVLGSLLVAKKYVNYLLSADIKLGVGYFRHYECILYEVLRDTQRALSLTLSLIHI